MIKITPRMVDKGARAIYKHASWDRAWKDIAPQGRSRFRRIAIDAIIAAIPNAICVIGRAKKRRPR